jgi:4-carboxymuconolactone decarboxylase
LPDREQEISGTRPRFEPLDPAALDDRQQVAASGLLAGATRAGGPGGQHMAATGSFPGPYDFLLRSPELALRWRQYAEYVRFDTSLPLRLNEFAILIQARYWTAQFEWWAHHPLALRAGLSEAVAEDLRHGRRPQAMTDDEAAVYDFCVELMQDRTVSDAVLERLRRQLSEQQVVDLVAVTGFYATVSMILNTVDAALPPGTPPPLPALTNRL